MLRSCVEAPIFSEISTAFPTCSPARLAVSIRPCSRRSAAISTSGLTFGSSRSDSTLAAASTAAFWYCWRARIWRAIDPSSSAAAGSAAARRVACAFAVSVSNSLGLPNCNSLPVRLWEASCWAWVSRWMAWVVRLMTASTWPNDRSETLPCCWSVVERLITAAWARSRAGRKAP